MLYVVQGQVQYNYETTIEGIFSDLILAQNRAKEVMSNYDSVRIDIYGINPVNNDGIIDEPSYVYMKECFEGEN